MPYFSPAMPDFSPLGQKSTLKLLNGFTLEVFELGPLMPLFVGIKNILNFMGSNKLKVILSREVKKLKRKVLA
jgi:hypothetical protein